MGFSKDEFINLRMSMVDYKEIPPEIRQRSEIKYVDVTGVDYTACPQWVEQKKVSDKEFKKLKQIEFNFRHNQK